MSCSVTPASARVSEWQVHEDTFRQWFTKADTREDAKQYPVANKEDMLQ